MSIPFSSYHVQQRFATAFQDTMIETSLTGYDLINQPMLNKGTAFTDVTEIRSVSVAIALAVAEQARKENLALAPPGDDLEAAVRGNVWEPRYQPYRLIK